MLYNKICIKFYIIILLPNRPKQFKRDLLLFIILISTHMYTNPIKRNYIRYILKRRIFGNDVTVTASGIFDACANKKKMDKKWMSSGMWWKKNNIIKNNNNFEKPVYTHTTIYTSAGLSYTHITHTLSLSLSPLSLLPQETIRFAASRRALCISRVRLKQ